jgi:acyl carrier protein
MKYRDELRQIVDAALDEINELLPFESQLAKDNGSLLLGEGGKLDSMGAITLVVALSCGLEKRYGHSAELSENPEIFVPDGVLKSVGTLLDFLQGLQFDIDRNSRPSVRA